MAGIKGKFVFLFSRAHAQLRNCITWFRTCNGQGALVVRQSHHPPSLMPLFSLHLPSAYRLHFVFTSLLRTSVSLDVRRAHIIVLTIFIPQASRVGLFGFNWHDSGYFGLRSSWVRVSKSVYFSTPRTLPSNCHFGALEVRLI